MELKNYFAGALPILGLIGIMGSQTLDAALNARSERVKLPTRSVWVQNWSDGRGIEVHTSGFQTIHDKDKDGIVDYISGGATSRIGTVRYTLEPTQAWQQLYNEAISKSHVVDIERSE